MTSAPSLKVARRCVVAVDHPMVIKNLDNAIKTFGLGAEITGRPFSMIINVDDPEACIPLYLRYQDAMSTPILSHNSSTNNILLKITVPKRTGRKRKRGSQDPYTGDPIPPVAPEQGGLPDSMRSHSRLDNPQELQKTLQDNADNYEVEAVAEIDRTHRFRGLSDFHQSTSHTELAPKFQKLVYSCEVDKIRQFKFNPSRGWKKNEEIVPPPVLTHHVLPFNWGWHQNPNIIQTINATTGESGLLNRSKSRKYQIEYLSHDVENTPQQSPFPAPNDPDLQKFVEELKEALDERPLWTRRALSNRVGNSPYLYLFKSALQYVGYQFKGGPFRDAVIKFGIDPRKDSKYRDYQTIFFKLYEEEEKAPFRKWHDNRTMSISKRTKRTDLTTHLFDGKSLTLDGKVWQFCDITDPLLAKLVRNAPVAHEFDSTGSGWFNNGTWAKIRAVMKLKLTVIRLGKTIEDEEFEATIHKVPDIIDASKKMGHRIGVPLPDIKFTDAELEKLNTSGISSFGGSKWKSDLQGKARKSRLRDRRVAERKAKTEALNTTQDLMPSIEISEAGPAMFQAGRPQTRGAGQSSQVGTIESAEAENYLDLDDDDDSVYEDEDFDDGDSGVDDDGSDGEM